MPIIGTVQATGEFAPTNSGDTYAIIDDKYVRGGSKNVDALSDLDAISSDRRKAGMIVGVSGGTFYYKLNTGPWSYDITDWTEFSSGGSTVQPGTNIFTGGTSLAQTINLTAATIDNLTVSGNTSLGVVSATTFISGSTNLYDIFLTSADGNDITRVQPGTNIFTGGSANAPTVNLTAATLTGQLELMQGTTVKAPLKMISGNLVAQTGVGEIEFNIDDYYAGITTPLPDVFASNYPPNYNDTYVKSTSSIGPYGAPYLATDPSKSLIGGGHDNSWTSSYAATNERFHIDLGSEKVINRIYYENFHNFGGYDYSGGSWGAKNFTLWGTNSAAAFAELTYGIDTDWTLISLSSNVFEQHSLSDSSDPKYISATNTNAYRYYAIKIEDSWQNWIALRRIELQYGSANYRKGIVLNDGTNLSSGKLPVASTNGRLIDSIISSTSAITTVQGGFSATSISATTIFSGSTNLEYFIYGGNELFSRTIYVETTGDDITGNGTTIGTAFATISRAIQDIELNVYSSITINLGAGSFDFTQNDNFELSRKRKAITSQIIFSGTTGEVIVGPFTMTRNSSDWTNFNVIGASLGADNSKKLMCLRPVVSKVMIGYIYENTSSTLTIQANITPGSNQYEIVEALTTINNVDEFEKIFDISCPNPTGMPDESDEYISDINDSTIFFREMIIVSNSVLSWNYGVFLQRCLIDLTSITSSTVTRVDIKRTKQFPLPSSYIRVDTTGGVPNGIITCGQHMQNITIENISTTHGVYFLYLVEYYTPAVLVSNILLASNYKTNAYALRTQSSQCHVSFGMAKLVNIYAAIYNGSGFSKYGSTFFVSNVVTNNVDYLIREISVSANTMLHLTYPTYTSTFNLGFRTGGPKYYCNPGYGYMISAPGLFNEIDTSLVKTLTNNTTTTFQIGDITQNRKVSIEYSMVRGSNYQSGVIEITHNGTTPYILENHQETSDLGITFDSTIVGNVLNLTSVLTNTGSNATMTMNIKRIMI